MKLDTFLNSISNGKYIKVYSNEHEIIFEGNMEDCLCNHKDILNEKIDVVDFYIEADTFPCLDIFLE